MNKRIKELEREMMFREIKRPSIAVNENFIDRAIEFISPTQALKRRQSRMVLALTGGYKGASKSRRGLSEYNPKSGSADADINYDLPTLRDRSRDLVRNNPLGGGAISTTVNSVVGTGIRLNARVNRDILGMTPDEAKEFERQAEYGFGLWAEGCDIERTLSFYEMQELAFRSTLENGDIVILLPYQRRQDDAFGLKLQAVEADRLCNPNGGMDSATMSGGVELDEVGAPKTYHILSVHPGDYGKAINREWKGYSAFASDGRPNVLHLFRKLRAGQHRGVPYLAPVIEALKQIERYSDAELMAAVVAGMFTVFIESESGEEFAPMMPTSETGATSADEDIKLDYGAVVSLAQGDKIETTGPGRPNAQFDPFVQAVYRQIGVALELPYEVLVKHFTSSYSAARAAILEAWRFFLSRRAWLTRSFCQPVYRAWMTEAIASGYLYAPGFFDSPYYRAAYLGAEWIGPTQGQIDPVKEVQAAEKRLSLKLTTRSEECVAITGTDWESKVPQMKYEEELVGGVTAEKKKPDEEKPDEVEEENKEGSE